MSDDAPGLPKVYLLAALIILLGMLAIFAVNAKDAPPQPPVAELTAQAAALTAEAAELAAQAAELTTEAQKKMLFVASALTATPASPAASSDILPSATDAPPQTPGVELTAQAAALTAEAAKLTAQAAALTVEAAELTAEAAELTAKAQKKMLSVASALTATLASPADPSDFLPFETEEPTTEEQQDAASGTRADQTTALQGDASLTRTPDGTEDETFTRTVDGTKEIISGTVARGDTAAKLLGSAVHDIMQASRKHHSLANIRSGQPYTVVRDRETKVLERFEYEIDAHRKLVVELDGSAFTSRVEPIVYDIQLALLQGSVESSLFQSVAALGESPSLAVVVAEVFRWDVDFIRDVQDGDSFSILVEKRFRDGRFKNYGRVLGATFTNKGKLFEAFLFRGVSANASHYNAKGESLHKALLKAPLAFTRITSGYSKGRKHPIFHDVRPHEGVDYAAPTGTPIKAVGDGVVCQKGWQGGYGNTIAIRHGGGLESQYAHMSGYARGMAVGARVRQGQVIGFVGMTGWATGPHLDFRLKQQGRFLNPSKASNPREESIAPGRMQAFEARKTQVRAFVSGVTPLYLYKPDAFQ